MTCTNRSPRPHPRSTRRRRTQTPSLASRSRPCPRRLPLPSRTPHPPRRRSQSPSRRPRLRAAPPPSRNRTPPEPRRGAPWSPVSRPGYARAMASESETAAVVALLRHGRGTPTEYANRIEDAGSAIPVARDELGLLASDLLAAAADELATWVERGLHVLTILDAAYPENLGAVHDRPPLIFVAGDLLARDARAVAVIGSRDATPAGLAAELGAHCFTVASGLARGIDTAAHTAALEAGGRTVAVIGTGLDHSYPPENAALQRRIATRGAVVSQFWPDSPPTRPSFPLRNRVTSGLSLANVLVEASPRSGALTQARIALGHGRPVLLMDRLLGQRWARELAGRPGVHVAASPAEVIETVERLSSTRALLD